MSDEDPEGQDSETRRLAIEQALRNASMETPRNSDPGGSHSAELPWQLREMVDGKYRLDALLGQGGMGAVYSATHMVTHRQVAIKLMLPSVSSNEHALARFIRESQVASKVKHPNIVDVYDVGQHGDSLFLVMELLGGHSLRHIVANESPMDPKRAIGLMLGAISGVAAAHEQDIVHRDLKPDNIMLVKESELGRPPHVMVLDFGISKLATGDGFHKTLTRAGEVMGTPVYMSPEQIADTKNADHRSDVYSLGVIMYEMLEGDHPFDGENFGALAIAIATKPARPIARHMPQELKAWILKAMSRLPDDRHASADQMRSELLAVRDKLLSWGAAATMHSTPDPITAPQPTEGDAASAPETLPHAGGAPAAAGAAVAAGSEAASTVVETPLTASPEDVDPVTLPPGPSRAPMALIGVASLALLGWLATGGDDDAEPLAPKAVAVEAGPVEGTPPEPVAEPPATPAAQPRLQPSLQAVADAGAAATAEVVPAVVDEPAAEAAAPDVAVRKRVRKERRRTGGQSRVRTDGKQRRAGKMDPDDF